MFDKMIQNLAPAVTLMLLAALAGCGGGGRNIPSTQPTSSVSAAIVAPGTTASPIPSTTGAPNSTPTPLSPYSGMSLIFEDTFNYNGAPNPAYWDYNVGTGPPYPGWGNNQQEYDTSLPANVFVNGALNIVAQAQSFGGAQYTSARLISRQSWLYGRFDVSAKLPCGQGTWPAIWMLPQNPVYGVWPASGELDIAELSNKIANSTTILGTEHTAVSGAQGTNATAQVPTDCSAFHLYSMDWDTAVRYNR